MSHQRILFALLTSALLFTPNAFAQTETWAQRIASLEANFREAPRGRTLRYLAEAREAAGLLDKAESTWSYLASRFGDEESEYRGHTTAENKLTYRQLAPWMKQRIARKRNLQRRGAVSPEEKGRALRASMTLMDPPPVQHLEAQRNIDMDGDGIDEVIVYGRNGPLGKGVRDSMAIWKFDGRNSYSPIWSTYKKPLPAVEYADHNTEWNALNDGFMEVVLKYSGKRVQTLYFNGRDFIFTIVN